MKIDWTNIQKMEVFMPLSRKHIPAKFWEMAQIRLRTLYRANLHWSQPIITHEEIIDYFADPSIRDTLKNIRKFAQVGRNPEGFNIAFKPEITIHVEMESVAGKSPPLLPLHTILQEGSEEFITKIYNWAAQAVELNINFAITKAMVQQLFERCSSLEQLRFTWPAIQALLTVDIPNTKPRAILTFEPEERELIKRATTTIARSALLPSGEATIREVHLSLKFNNYEFTFEGNTFDWYQP
jgi:hypothetical protein